MINYKKFINQSLIVILYLMPIIFFAGYDFAFVTYDSEPDYISAVFQSFYDKWLNVSNNVIRLDICQELNSITNKKVYLIDSRFIDSVNSNQIIKDLRLVVENCGFKLYKNTKYLNNNEIFAYDIY